jgi:hypothetical protein
MSFEAYFKKARSLSYYMGTEDTPRHLLGLIADFLLPVIGFFSVLYLWLVFRTRSALLSLIIDLAVSFLFAYDLFLRKRAFYREKRNQVRRQLGRDYMASQLSALSRQEFEWQLVRALSSLKGLKDIEQRQGYLKARYNNVPIAIGYHHSPPKGYVTYEKVWAFYNTYRSKGYSNHIYISSGYFEDACKNIKDEALQIPITLMDIDDLLDLMEKAGMTPGEEDLDRLAEQRIAEIKRKARSARNRTATPYRMKRYMLASLLFLGLSLLFRKYFLFYFVLSALYFVLGLISQVLYGNYKEYDSKTPQ